jgi:hypothetical protein
MFSPVSHPLSSGNAQARTQLHVCARVCVPTNLLSCSMLYVHVSSHFHSLGSVFPVCSCSLFFSSLLFRFEKAAEVPRVQSKTVKKSSIVRFAEAEGPQYCLLARVMPVRGGTLAALRGRPRQTSHAHDSYANASAQAGGARPAGFGLLAQFNPGANPRAHLGKNRGRVISKRYGVTGKAQGASASSVSSPSSTAASRSGVANRAAMFGGPAATGSAAQQAPAKPRNEENKEMAPVSQPVEEHTPAEPSQQEEVSSARLAAGVTEDKRQHQGREPAVDSVQQELELELELEGTVGIESTKTLKKVRKVKCTTAASAATEASECTEDVTPGTTASSVSVSEDAARQAEARAEEIRREMEEAARELEEESAEPTAPQAEEKEEEPVQQEQQADKPSSDDAQVQVQGDGKQDEPAQSAQLAATADTSAESAELDSLACQQAEEEAAFEKQLAERAAANASPTESGVQAGEAAAKAEEEKAKRAQVEAEEEAEAEAEAARRVQEEAAVRVKAEEEATRRAQEEAAQAAKRAQEEEDARKAAEEEAASQKATQEAATVSESTSDESGATSQYSLEELKARPAGVDPARLEVRECVCVFFFFLFSSTTIHVSMLKCLRMFDRSDYVESLDRRGVRGHVQDEP